MYMSKLTCWCTKRYLMPLSFQSPWPTFQGHVQISWIVLLTILQLLQDISWQITDTITSLKWFFFLVKLTYFSRSWVSICLFFQLYAETLQDHGWVSFIGHLNQHFFKAIINLSFDNYSMVPSYLFPNIQTNAPQKALGGRYSLVTMLSFWNLLLVIFNILCWVLTITKYFNMGSSITALINLIFKIKCTILRLSFLFINMLVRFISSVWNINLKKTCVLWPLVTFLVYQHNTCMLLWIYKFLNEIVL